MSKFQPITVTEDELSALDNEHDDVMQFKGPALAPWLCVVRRPNAEEAIKYKIMANDQNPMKAIDANLKLIERLCVYPKGDDWKRQIARWPLFPDGMAKNVRFQQFCGIEGIVDEREK